MAKVLTRLLKLLVGKLPRCIQCTRDFVNRVGEVTLLPEKCLNSYDVSALFTSVPIDPDLNIIKDLLKQDDILHDRFELPGYCLHNAYFSFQNKFYEQVKGVAMGPLVSPIIAILYMEYFERETPVLPQTPQVLFRFVDDTYVIQQQAHKQLFHDHINSVDPAIKFTVEGNQEKVAIPFLDTMVQPKADISLSITVY